MGVHIVQVRILATSVFLIVLDSEKSGDIILKATPVVVATKLALILPYKADINV
jgi:hypothetical protein